MQKNFKSIKIHYSNKLNFNKYSKIKNFFNNNNNNQINSHFHQNQFFKTPRHFNMNEKEFNPGFLLLSNNNNVKININTSKILNTTSKYHFSLFN